MGDSNLSSVASKSDSTVLVENSGGIASLSDGDCDLLARQIATLDGVTYAQAQQQIREMVGVDFDPGCPSSMTLYNLWTADRPQRLDSIRPRPASGCQCDPSSNGSAEEIVRRLRTERKMDAVPRILDVLCNTTGMRYAAVAKVFDEHWSSCAVPNRSASGDNPGGKFDGTAGLRLGSQATEKATVIDPLTSDFRHTPAVTRLHGVESYISAPIVTSGGRHYGNLCAIGPSPSRAADPRVVSTFQSFARIIAQQLEDELTRETQQNVLHDERAASELREQFIAILGHDLRNPLHAILATADLLERRLDESGLTGMATRIKTSARRMSALIDDVMDFARGRLGSGIDVEIGEVDDIAGDLTAVVRELQESNPSRQISVDISVPGRVFCDKWRVQQMASNLVANALTHGSAQRPIRVTASADDEYMSFSVWNDGEPIPASSIDKVFKPFWRHTVSTGREGLGLGLYICSQIVRAHAGVLSVTSTRESGTVFNVRLPVRNPAVAVAMNGGPATADSNIASKPSYFPENRS